MQKTFSSALGSHDVVHEHHWFPVLLDSTPDLTIHVKGVQATSVVHRRCHRCLTTPTSTCEKTSTVRAGKYAQNILFIS